MKTKIKNTLKEPRRWRFPTRVDNPFTIIRDDDSIDDSEFMRILLELESRGSAQVMMVKQLESIWKGKY